MRFGAAALALWIASAPAQPALAARHAVDPFTSYCQYIAPPGDDQEIALDTPAPAGSSIHVAVATSQNVSLDTIEDLAATVYLPAESGAAGVFTGTLSYGITETALPVGESVTVHLAAVGGGGTSCVSGFVAQQVIAADDAVFTTGSGSPAALATPLALTPEVDLAHVLLFGHPSGIHDPGPTRQPPLLADSSVCVGTSSGRLCAFDSHADGTGSSFDPELTFADPLDWGMVVALYAPEPGSAAGIAVALLAVAARATRKRYRRSPSPRDRSVPCRAMPTTV